MRHRKKKFVFVFFISLVFGMIISSPIIISHYYLPEKVKLIAGKDHIFNFDIPLKASILKDKIITVKSESNNQINSESISLNKPLHVSMNQVGTTDVTLYLSGVIHLQTVSIEAVPAREDKGNSCFRGRRI